MSGTVATVPNPFEELRALTVRFDDLFSPTDCEFLEHDALRDQLGLLGDRMVSSSPCYFPFSRD